MAQSESGRLYRGRAGQRYADALLRVLGGTSVTVRFPVAATGDDGSQLGLEQPPAEDLSFNPAVVRKLRPTEEGRGRLEVLLSPAGVMPAAQSHNVVDIGEWLKGALGVMFSDSFYLLDGVQCDHLSGADYLYHLFATEQ
jgi:hypothetical protein